MQRDTNDTPIGNPALRPSQVLAAWARTLQRFGPTVAGDGTASGTWANALRFTWTGERIGGSLTSDDALRRMGTDWTYLTLSAALADGSPLGKIIGLYLARLHAAVAHLNKSSVILYLPLVRR